MKIFKSFGEFATIFLLLVLVVLGGMFWILRNGNSARYKSLTNNAIRFSDVVGLNLSSFSNERLVFLDEVLDGGYMSNIKSPFSTNNCDGSRSFVEVDSNIKYVTLTCDDYMLNRYRAGDKDIDIYEISDWKFKREDSSDLEENIYNCLDSNGNTVFEKYNEEKYFLYEVNSKFGTNYYDINTIDNSKCIVDKKVAYRTMKKVDINES